MPGPNSRNKFQKPKNVKGTLLRLLSYLAKKKGVLVLVVIFILLSSLGMVASSFFVKPLIDNLVVPLIGQETTKENMMPIIKALGFMASLFLISVVSSYVYQRIMLYISQGTVNAIRRDLFDALQDLPISFFDGHTHGELMSRFTNDVETVRNFLSQTIVQTIQSMFTVLATFVAMLVLSRWMTLWIVIFTIMMILIIKKLGSKSSTYFRKQQKDLGVANGYIEETIEGQKVIKVFNHEGETVERFNELNGNLRRSATSANTFASILMPIMGNLSYINYAILSVFGGFLVITGNITVGAISSFLLYSRQYTQPITNLSQQFNNILSALAGAERIFDIIDAEKEEDNGYVMLVNAVVDENGEIKESDKRTNIWAWKHTHGDGTVTYKRLEGKVEFENVVFSYDGKKTVLNDISLYAKPGQKIAFVGSTGAGKTTITNLINRFYEIQQGKIRYDGINIKKIKKTDLRRSLGMVLQDTHLFTGTVKDNIRYGKLDATDEEVIKAAKIANAHSFITRLPHGYDTLLTGDGSNLSQGQRQLLSIARAAVADPPVLILDEATSSIDTRTERLIEKGMDALMEGRTVFVIAHRLSTVRNSNAIMVLEHGEIIERGDHDDLLEQKGKYYQLYTGQFELS
ncbi:MAG: ABC transporter ATP-binding protein [Ruminococcaceae bacterium]|nr:ABC transporter ATP-binding protein [Oscillospiraceae bacterium]